MRILLLTQVFRPDGVSSALVLGDLVADMRDMGHSITVLTTVPHYNRDEVAEEEQPIQKFWGRLLQTSSFSDCRVLHAYMPRRRASLALRVASWSVYHSVALLAGMVAAEKPDIILAASPPPSVGAIAWLLSRVHRVPYVYNVKERYPKLGEQLGMFGSPALIRVLSALETFVYRRAGAVVSVTQRMADDISGLGLTTTTVCTIADSTEMPGPVTGEKAKGFADSCGLKDKFIVSYAGNFGLAQDLMTVVEAARLLQNRPDIAFLLVGGGVQSDRLKDYCRAHSLHNVTFLPYMPSDRMPELYAASKLSIATIVTGVNGTAFPSKIYRIMGNGCAILGCADADSEVAQLIDDADAGWVVEPGHARDLADTIAYTYDHPEELRRRATNGPAYVRPRFARNVIALQYHDLLSRVARTESAAG